MSVDYFTIGMAYKSEQVYLLMVNIKNGKIRLKKVGTIDLGVLEFDKNKDSTYQLIKATIFPSIKEDIPIDYFTNMHLRYSIKKNKWKFIGFNAHKIIFKVVKSEYENIKHKVDFMSMTGIAINTYLGFDVCKLSL